MYSVAWTGHFAILGAMFRWTENSFSSNVAQPELKDINVPIKSQGSLCILVTSPLSGAVRGPERTECTATVWRVKAFVCHLAWQNSTVANQRNYLRQTEDSKGKIVKISKISFPYFCKDIVRMSSLLNKLPFSLLNTRTSQLPALCPGSAGLSMIFPVDLDLVLPIELPTYMYSSATTRPRKYPLLTTTSCTWSFTTAILDDSQRKMPSRVDMQVCG